MEVFYYRCEVCGYVHQVPSYWMSYEPEQTCEQMHFSPQTHEGRGKCRAPSTRFKHLS